MLSSERASVEVGGEVRERAELPTVGSGQEANIRNFVGMERDPPFPTTEGGAAAAGGVMGSFSKEELRKLYSDDPFCAAEIAHAAGVDDTRRMLAVLKGIFERLKRTMRELGVVELSEKLVSALALSLEQTTKNAQVGELASAVLALFVEHCSPEGHATTRPKQPGLFLHRASFHPISDDRVYINATS